VVAKIQHQRSYEELAAVLGKPTPDAARMAAARALVRLAHAMAQPGDRPSGAETGSRDGQAVHRHEH